MSTKANLILMEGTGYLYFDDIVIVERNTVVPGMSGQEHAVIEYQVARGIGVVRSVGEFTMYEQPLALELVETNLQRQQ